MDPKLFFSDPDPDSDPTFQEILYPDPDPDPDSDTILDPT